MPVRMPEFKSRYVVTAGWPYANGKLHLGHMGGAHVPADIKARFLRQAVGAQNVLFVCGTDDHGTVSVEAAADAGLSVQDFIAGHRASHEATFARYGVSLSVYGGTSHPIMAETHREMSQEFLRRLFASGMLEKRTTEQPYDPVDKRFIQDRQIVGQCPTPECTNTQAYGDECGVCNTRLDPTQLKDPKSRRTGAVPEWRKTSHWFLNMWKVSDPLVQWLKSRAKAWRRLAWSDSLETVMPSISFMRTSEDAYKGLKGTLPAHKIKYMKEGRMGLVFETMELARQAQAALSAAGIENKPVDGWGFRSITRDIPWGIPVPDLDGQGGVEGKTLYVWPDSLIAPISLTKAFLEQRGEGADAYRRFWCDPSAGVVQFLGLDNVFFYTVMQGAMWLGQKADPQTQPGPGELQMTDIVANAFLLLNGKKMSKSQGNYYTADDLLDKNFDGRHYAPDVVRMYLARINFDGGEPNFDFPELNKVADLLGSRYNSAIEKPISAAHAKFDGKVPQGILVDDVVKLTEALIQRYVSGLDKTSYPGFLLELDNYAQKLNGLLKKYRPNDDRLLKQGTQDPAQRLIDRQNGLYSALYMLKNLMIMMQPFAPFTAEKIRQSLNLPESVFALSELGKPMEPGHAIGAKLDYFPGAVTFDKGEGPSEED